MLALLLSCVLGYIKIGFSQMVIALFCSTVQSSSPILADYNLPNPGFHNCLHYCKCRRPLGTRIFDFGAAELIWKRQEQIQLISHTHILFLEISEYPKSFLREKTRAGHSLRSVLSDLEDLEMSSNKHEMEVL